MAKREFQTEVSKLLKLIIHSLYSHKEIFLRELVSNASDALDKVKFMQMTDSSLRSQLQDYRIDLSFLPAKAAEGDAPAEAAKLIIADTGIGMNEEDLDAQLGTIAKSGTSAFIEQLENKADANLIGQFGVGFYSAFMVASKVEVLTKKIGTEQAYVWSSDGENAYEVNPAEKDSYGTSITLTLNDEGKEYASRWMLESLIKKYSDHISFPIYLSYDEKSYDDEGKETGVERKTVQVNHASALWTRSKSEITEEEYQNFYKSISRDSEDALSFVHTKAEGAQEYTTLFYIPKKAPMDMMRADYAPGVKLYINRVFITDDEKELMPVYLRFLRGFIDSQDLPLNVSREMLQQNRQLSAIRNASVKKVLAEILELAEKNPEHFATFTSQYNRQMKEGLYGDYAHRDQLFEIVRYKSTTEDGYTSLKSYVARMPEDQKSIYCITGNNESLLRSSPFLGSCKKKGYEVLIMDDEIDEIVLPMLGVYDGKPFVAVNTPQAAEELKDDDGANAALEANDSQKLLFELMAAELDKKVSEVRLSKILSDDAPSALVADEFAPSLQMREMLRAMGQDAGELPPPALEINGSHPILAQLEAKVSATSAGSADEARDALSDGDKHLLSDVSWLLYEQALMLEGAAISDPARLVKLMNSLAELALKA